MPIQDRDNCSFSGCGRRAVFLLYSKRRTQWMLEWYLSNEPDSVKSVTILLIVTMIWRIEAEM